MTDAGLTVEQGHDWTTRVERTWEICRRRVRRSGVRWLAGMIDRNTAMFLDRFETILTAYRSGAMRVWLFHRPQNRRMPTKFRGRSVGRLMFRMDAVRPKPLSAVSCKEGK